MPVLTDNDLVVLNDVPAEDKVRAVRAGVDGGACRCGVVGWVGRGVGA